MHSWLAEGPGKPHRAGRLGTVTGHRLDIRTDHGPLPRPVLADGSKFLPQTAWLGLWYQQRQTSGREHESLCDHCSCGSDGYGRCCPGTDYHAERRCSHSGTVNSPHFHYDQLHDVVQFPRGELSNGLLGSPAAY